MRSINLLLVFLLSIFSAHVFAADAVCISEDQEVQLVIFDADDMIFGRKAFTRYYTVYNGVQSETKTTALILAGSTNGASSDGTSWSINYVDLVLDIPGPFGASIGSYQLHSDGTRQVMTEEAMFDCELSE